MSHLASKVTKGKNNLHIFLGKGLQVDTEQSQKGIRGDIYIIGCAKSFENFRPERGKTKTYDSGPLGTVCTHYML